MSTVHMDMAMPSAHPLMLPEIVSQVAVYVQQRTLPACTLVSRTWYSVFNSILWRQILLDGADPPTAIQKHAHLVKKLTIDSFRMTQELCSLRFPNLTSLDLIIAVYSQDMVDMIAGHPSATRLSVKILMMPLLLNSQQPLWSTILGCNNLNDLTIAEVRLHGQEVDTFWQICTRLERLKMDGMWIPCQGNMMGMEFPKIKEVVLSTFSMDGFSWFLEFLQRCPNLESLDWGCGPVSEFVVGFADLVAVGTWPGFHSLRIDSSVAVNVINKIIQGMEHITSLTFWQSGSMLGLASLDLLRSRFHHLKVLDVKLTPDISSRFSQEVLSSCPHLEKFMGGRIDAIDILKGSPWICLQLKYLELHFHFESNTIRLLQPVVLDQISRLTRLVGLHIMGCPNGLCDPSKHVSLDLTLENGLGTLSTLRMLRVVVITTAQRMCGQEISWMIEHWSGLGHLYGILNMQEVLVDEALRKRLIEHGILGSAIVPMGDVFEDA
ncbi:hypothetical protein B0O80DRAFT_502208 [Mortierella sp. GBAus27b]|nr:hypothetical protein BGX31_008293 [Mortierella sp. GBA43]KAI8348073.1 hypothetical protein B0O80DRAFT_502208 [Mortierella sp. GBAus27b]